MPRPALTAALAATLAAAGCGAERVDVPDVSRPYTIEGPAVRAFPEAGVSFQAPADWRFDPGQEPLVATTSSGSATIAIWRYPRTEPLPKDDVALDQADGALQQAATTRDERLRVQQSRRVKVDGARGIQLVGTQQVIGARRQVRSTHVYAKGAEYVIDTYAAPRDFELIDRTVFQPLVKTFKIDPAAVVSRAFVVVMDAVGVGELPDSADYGDVGTNTVGHLSEALGGLDVPTLGRLGLGSIIDVAGVPPAEQPGTYGRLHPLGPGKDSTSGHWELMGVVLDQAPPGYPEGFPPDLVAELEQLTGREFLLNRPYNGVAAIEDYGEEHLRTGKLILYTSADSVLQIAAHHDVLSEDELVELCRRIRAMLRPPHEVGRVIARPFEGEPGAFRRTAGRKDLSLAPPARSYLDELHDDGVPVHAVGKVYDLFTGRGIDTKHPGSTNAEALASTTRLIEELGAGLVFVNLVETDQNYGHRGDLEGFHRALQGIDAAVAGWLGALRPGDLLILTADHGVDMTTPGSDHTREHAPLLAAGDAVPSARHDGPFADVGATVLRHLSGREAPALPGSSFL